MRVLVKKFLRVSVKVSVDLRVNINQQIVQLWCGPAAMGTLRLHASSPKAITSPFSSVEFNCPLGYVERNQVSMCLYSVQLRVIKYRILKLKFNKNQCVRVFV